MGKGPLRVRTHPFMMCQQAGALFYAGMEVSGLHNVPDIRESDFQYPYDEKALIWSERLAGYSLLRQRGHKMDAIEIRKYMAELVGTFVLVLAGGHFLRFRSVCSRHVGYCRTDLGLPPQPRCLARHGPRQEDHLDRVRVLLHLPGHRRHHRCLRRRPVRHGNERLCSRRSHQRRVQPPRP